MGFNTVKQLPPLLRGSSTNSNVLNYCYRDPLGGASSGYQQPTRMKWIEVIGKCAEYCKAVNEAFETPSEPCALTAILVISMPTSFCLSIVFLLLLENLYCTQL